MKRTTAALTYGVASALIAWGFVSAFGVDSAQAQSMATTRPPMANTPQTVNGFVTMTSGLMVDGGITTTYVRSGREDVQDLYVDGGTSLNTLEVGGYSTFRQRPGGVFLAGALVKGAAVTVGVGRAVLGTTNVAGASVLTDGCVVAAIPAAALTLGVTYDCYITSANTVTVYAVGVASLVAAPAGIYRVIVLGPAG